MMTFVRQMIIDQTEILPGELSEIEKSGDPFAVAVEHLETSTTKEEDWIGPPRASSLLDACMRFHVLGVRARVKKVQWENFGNRMVFGFGNAVHYWVQNSPDLLGDNRYGFWKCRACGKIITTFGPFPNKKCSKCKAGKAAWVYFEYGGHTKKRKLNFTFHVDVFIKVKNLYRIVEVKTIKGEAFEELKAPLAPHEYQITAYTMGCKESKMIPSNFDPKVAYMLYIAKKSYAKHMPVKMFPVVISEEIKNRIKDKVGGYVDGFKDFPNNLPELHDECKKADFHNYRANTCVVKARCRSLYGK